jgi:septal ring factor EnvC (AmiA/AmiB activator)
MISDYEILNILGLKQLQNIFSLSRDAITQIDILKIRYYQQATFLDRLARDFGEQNEFFKILLKYFSVGLSILSFFSLSIAVTVAMIVFTAFVFFLDAHYQVMETRFSQLSHDLEVSEKKLQQAVAQNMDLESQLSNAVQKNQAVTHELGEIKKDVIHLREKILEKEQIIEKTRGLLEDSTGKIQVLISEITEIKKNLSDKALHFSEQVACTEKQMQRFFGTSNQLKESSEFREQMDQYLEENFPGMFVS